MDLPKLGMLPAPALTALSPRGRATCGSWGGLAEGGRGMQEMGTQSADPSGSLLCPAPAPALAWREHTYIQAGSSRAAGH